METPSSIQSCSNCVPSELPACPCRLLPVTVGSSPRCQRPPESFLSKVQQLHNQVPPVGGILSNPRQAHSGFCPLGWIPRGPTRGMGSLGPSDPPRPDLQPRSRRRLYQYSPFSPAPFTSHPGAPTDQRTELQEESCLCGSHRLPGTPSAARSHQGHMRVQLRPGRGVTALRYSLMPCNRPAAISPRGLGL